MNLADLQSALSALHFLRPPWFWALLLLPLLAWAWRARARRDNVWRASVDAHLLPHLLQRGGGARGQAGLWLTVIAFALAISALAGPSWRQREQPLLQGNAPLVIALDLSSATLASDLPPSRLLQARAKLANLLKQRAGGQVGLVAFADDAYTVAPLTQDAANVALFLDALAPDVMPVDGSRADRAIAWSEKLLRQAGYANGDILVLSDHAGRAAIGAATAARRDGYRVSALGLGTPAGAAYRTPQGAIAHAQLDAASLRALANAGGGHYAPLSAGNADLVALGVLDAQALQQQVSTHSGKAAVWEDGGYWLLPVLMLLALLAFRRGGAFAVVLLCVLWLPLQPARAADTGDDTGTPWRRADQVQHQRMQEGVAAYTGKDYAAAAQDFARLPGADAAYNHGNALAKAGKYEDAINAYDQALRQQPDMADAIANKRAVEAVLKRTPPPKQDGRDQQKQPPQGGQKNEGKPNAGQQGQSDGKSQLGQPPPPPQAEQGKADRGAEQHGQPQPPQAGGKQQDAAPQSKQQQAQDAEAQRKADAEQRARMQQALKEQQQVQPQAENGTKAHGEPVRTQSAAERERARANDAWLQRVPDDPGGLLRTKFRLEYERRQGGGRK